MGKAATRSRWIHFSVDASFPVFDYIKTCGCEGAHWITFDAIIKGYLYFPQPLGIPRKKKWIPGATYFLSTQADLKALFAAVPPDNWHNYGSQFLFEIPHHTPFPKVVLPPHHTPSPLVDSDSDDEPIHLQPFALDVAGTRISKATVNLLLMPEFMQVDMVARLDFGQRSLFDVECQYVLAHYDAYMIALLAAQRDSS